MREFLYSTDLWLPRDRVEVFEFFAEAGNLQAITPPWVNFKVLTPAPIILQAGTLIDYRIRVHGIPFRWRTEIAEWEPPFRFVDTQLTGPYRLWHHTHSFVEENGGTRCLDVVRYRPLGGWLMNSLFVRHDVERIFAYRRKRLLDLFGRPAPAQAGG